MRDVVYVHVPKSGGTAFSDIVARAACANYHMEMMQYVVQRSLQGAPEIYEPVLSRLDLEEWTRLASCTLLGSRWWQYRLKNYTVVFKLVGKSTEWAFGQIARYEKGTCRRIHT